MKILHRKKSSLKNETVTENGCQEKDSQSQRMNLGLPGGEGQGGGIDWEFGVDMYTLLYLKQITNKDQCIAQGTLLNTL